MRSLERCRFLTLTWKHLGTVVSPPEAVEDYLSNADEPPSKIGEVWMTQEEYEALPEFES